jgi:cellulose synthase/poly-beta-1,6-N-acetylglucosamine synthase-like glycosyltransferase
MPSIFEIIDGLWRADPQFLTWYIAQGRVILDFLHILFDRGFYIFLYIMAAFTSVYIVLAIIVMASKKKTNEKKFDILRAPFVTIQIPTRNETIAIRCAEKCLRFDYPQDKYEILIGDDSNKPGISRQLDEFAAKHPNIRVIRRKNNTGFKPGNLNNMLKQSRGEILVIFDSDFTPNEDFLKRITAQFINDKNVSAVQAKWNFENFDQNLVTILASTTVYTFHHIMLSFLNLLGSGSLCGSAEAIKKKDLIELGCWRSGSLTEDIEFTLRLYKAGKKIVYMPKLECYSEVPYVAKDLYRQQMRWAYGVVTAYKIHLKDIILTKSLSIKKKLMSLCSGFGYLMPVLLALSFVLGTLSFVTHRPGPFDFAKFFSEMGRNVLLTSGMLLAGIIALAKEKKIKYSIKMMISSFSIGIVTVYYVNKGIFKSIAQKPMEWYLLNKGRQ